MPVEDDLQDLIERRREIDRALLERHAVEMAVLFTDIVGSTAYFEQRGDIEGLALVKRHNDLLFPVVNQHGGRVVKTIGDSIMAVFASAAEGIACAVALQETLAKETGTASVERIRIRVGVHFGRVLKDGDDVFGDTVNTAARVASAADGDEVIASQAAFDALAKGHGWLTAPKRALSAKGKSAPVPVVGIAWRDLEKENARAVSPEAKELFVIEVQRGPSGLRVAAMDGEGERGTVKAYADVALGSEEIAKLAEPFAVLAHNGGQAAYAQSLVEKGRALFERTLPERVRTRLLETKRHTVRLHLEDTLVQVPWELLHDGSDFLGCKFSVGRMVAARADTAVPPPSTATGDIVVLANCAGDLPHADEEGRVVAGLFEQALGPAEGRVILRSGALSRAAFLEAAKRARVLHVAGHVTRASTGAHAHSAGFVTSDGVVSADDLAAAFAQEGAAVPLLVFANGCHASTSTAWDQTREGASSSLAQSLLLAGVRHTLAPLWSVPDADALSFALRFYEGALAGVPFGESARRARRALAATHAAPLSFAGYVLYGDPRAALPPEDAKLPSLVRTRSGDHAPVVVERGPPPDHAPRVRPMERAETRPTGSVPRFEDDFASVTSSKNDRRDDARPTSSPTGRGSPLMLGSIGGAIVGVVIVAALLSRDGGVDRTTPATPAAPIVIGTIPPITTPPAPEAPKVVHTGPVRVSVMAFASTGTADPSLDYLKLGLPEVLVTSFASLGAASLGGQQVQIIERGQIDVDIAEIDFSQSKYVDPKTRAALGKIAGAEVAVLGAWQLAGAQSDEDAPLRFTARFVDVETGEVLAASKVDGKKSDVFALQDKLADEAGKSMALVAARMRP